MHGFVCGGFDAPKWPLNTVLLSLGGTPCMPHVMIGPPTYHDDVISSGADHGTHKLFCMS